MTIKESIRALKDVAGVGGAFLLGIEGTLVSHDMPTYFDLQTLRDVGPRIVRLLDVWTVDHGQVDCILRFSEGRLYLRAFDGAVLCVLLAPQVQLAALRTAVQLVIAELARFRAPTGSAARNRRSVSTTRFREGLEPEGGASGHGSSAPPPRPSSAPAAPPPVAGSARHVRVYRGQRYDP